MKTMPKTVVIPATAVDTLRTQLLQDEQERAAFAGCTRILTGERYCVVDIQPLADEEMAISKPGECRPTNAAERAFLSQCQDSDTHPLIVHSHPFAEQAALSSRDHDAIHRYADWLDGFLEADLLFGVLGQENLVVARYDPEQEAVEALPVSVVGDWKLDRPLAGQVIKPGMGLPPTLDTNRYNRNILVFGEQAQKQLAAATVGVVGCSGIGSFLVEQLARIGVGHLVLIDPDDVEESNLPRLVGAQPGDVGHPKVQVMQEVAHRANPDCITTAVYNGIGTESALEQMQAAGVDLLVSGVDQTSARYLLNEVSVRTMTPWVDAGTRIETTDDASEVAATNIYVQTVAPQATACFDCMERGNPEDAYREQLSETELQQQVERGYIDETALSPAPAVIMPNAMAAATAVDAVVKVVTGYDTPPDFIRHDLTSHEHAAITTAPRENCPTCGRRGVLGIGLDGLSAESVVPAVASDTDPAAEDVQEAVDPETITIDRTVDATAATESESTAVDTDDHGQDQYFPASVTAYFQRTQS